ncbi:MAG TPA: YncE family protein [Caulobacteraceae bacterium]|nr:YncE family protein [Caulobacteraceae bacterium]
MSGRGSIVRWAIWLLAGAAAIVVIGLALLVWPGRPGAARTLRFVGFTPLPAHKTLNVLDYLSIYGPWLFATSESGGEIFRVTLGPGAPERATVAVLPGAPATHGVVIDPASGLAFVTRSEVNAVDVFDPGAMRFIRRIPVAADPDGIFYDPADRLIWADSGDSKLATVIDPATQAKVGVVVLGGSPEFAAFDAPTGRLYQNLKDVNEVAVVDIPGGRVVERWPLPGCGGPTGMAIDAPDRRLFVVCSRNARLVILDLRSGREAAMLPIGGGPDSVAYDAALRRIYATGIAGVLTVDAQTGPDTYRQLDRIRLHFGAHTLAVDPATHRVYVGYAGLLVPPRLAVFDAIGPGVAAGN